jgi:hypothetical protein
MKKSKSAAAAAAAARQPSHAAQNGHVLPSKLARYLDPDASWDKVRLLAPDRPTAAAHGILTLTRGAAFSVAGSAAGRGALDPAGGGARVRPALGSRPPRRRLLDRPVSVHPSPLLKPQI